MTGRMIVAGALMFLVACIQDDEGNERPLDFAPPAATDTIGGARLTQESGARSPFERVAPDTGSIGSARLLESDATGELRTLAIEVSGLPAGRFEWQLRQAGCAPDEPADAIAAGTLDVGSAGFGEASAALPDADVAGYSVVIRTRAGAIVACAAL